MKLLIPGGAGYIGSHMVKYAQSEGHEVVVLDDFSTGHEWAIKDCEILNVNLLDADRLSRLLKNSHFDGVIHFAAKSLVPESIKKPNLYYHNNFTGTLNLVNEMIKNNINNLVFSSTAAIFGIPISENINEDHPKEPINPYGASKLMVERMLNDASKAYGINVTCLRYFNAAGAHKSSEIGEDHDPETHLIPNILNSLLSGNIFNIYGDDYSTKDGTCIRDYIHVMDLAEAHLLSLKKMNPKKLFDTFNLGNGKGYSIFEIINSCEKVSNLKLNYEVHDRRLGDPSFLISDSSKAYKELDWNPKFVNLDDIIESAFNWHKGRQL